MSRDVTSQSSIRLQVIGLYEPSTEHMCSTGQVRQGAFSTLLVSIGSLVAKSLYVHLPFSNIFSLLIRARRSRRIATREPSRLVRSSSFQSSDCNMPPLPFDTIVRNTLPVRSSIWASFRSKHSYPEDTSFDTQLINNPFWPRTLMHG